jgi:exodeoxyribonuclease VII large subunit
MQSSTRKVYRVSELTQLIKATLEEGFGAVWIEGEVSNVRRPASGHWYFTIKDGFAQIAAVRFRGERRGGWVEPRDGMQVRAFGQITVFAKGGVYQVVVWRLEESGQGLLQRRFEELKARLAAEGLFDPARKRPLPTLPQHIGIVTSPTGAALRDILKVLGRRFPNLHVLIAPTRVQGPEAAAEIAAAIERLNARGGLDVLIVGRGGGSLEDLWPFNEEIVARALAASRIPTVSAVGHEIDFTIADFVADLRAPTPSAAAELVVERKDVLEERVAGLERRTRRALGSAFEGAVHRLRAAARHYVFREPASLVRQFRERIGGLRTRRDHAIGGQIREGRQALDESWLRLRYGTEGRLQTKGEELRRITLKVGSLDPQAVLHRGYSLTTDEAGRAIRSVAGLTAGQRVWTRLAAGGFESEVKRLEPDERGQNDRGASPRGG